MATTATAAAMNIAVAAKDRLDKRAIPQTPCPEVQPPLSRVPKPTSSPATMMVPQLVDISGEGMGNRSGGLRAELEIGR